MLVDIYLVCDVTKQLFFSVVWHVGRQLKYAYIRRMNCLSFVLVVHLLLCVHAHCSAVEWWGGPDGIEA